MNKASTQTQPIATILATLAAPILEPQKNMVMAWVNINGKLERHWVED